MSGIAETLFGMTPRELEEYRALRATIRERGSLRLWLVFLGLFAWAGLTIATTALAGLPAASLVPLLVLAGDFEIVFGLHTSVERIGRYLQVFFEDAAADPGWEHRVMAFGRMFPASGADALFTPYFLAAAMANFLAALLAGPLPIEYAVVGGLHALFGARVLSARRSAARQRAIDLERFQQLKTRA
jgi:hypothetical protein